MSQIPTRTDARPGVASAFLSITGATLAWAAVGVGLVLPGAVPPAESAADPAAMGVEQRLDRLEHDVERWGAKLEALDGRRQPSRHTPPAGR